MDQPAARTLLERLQRERERGRLWRARELAHQYPNLLYDRELWLACGRLLLEIHDRERAGMLLFLAGSDDPEHGPAIDFYLLRNGKRAIGYHLRKVPSIDALPDRTRKVLASRGVERIPRQRELPTAKARRISDLITCALALAIGALVILGAVTVFRWIFG